MSAIDYIIILIYLIGLLAFGLFYKANIKNLEEYAVGKRNYNGFFITATMLATLIGGGSTLGLSTKVYEYGLLFILIPMISSIRQIIISFFLIKPIRNLNKKAISMGDIMQLWYGDMGRILTGLASAFLNIAFVAAQIGATGYLLELFIGIPYQIGAFVGMGIMVLYASTGGIHSVVITDVIQAFLLIIAIPLLIYLSIQHFGGIQEFNFSNFLFNINHSKHLSPANFINLLTTLLIGGALFPDYIQRILLSRSSSTAQRSTFSTALIAIPIYLMIGFIGVAAFHIQREGLNPNFAMLVLIQTVTPNGLMGLMIIALLGITMSTADTALNTASISIAQDVLCPLLKDKKYPHTKWLKLTKIVTFFLGFMTIFVALYMERIIDLIFTAFNFWAPLMLVPFIAGLYGYKIAKANYLLMSLISLLTTLIWYSFCQNLCLWLSPILVGTLSSLLFFSFFYFREKKA